MRIKHLDPPNIELVRAGVVQLVKTMMTNTSHVQLPPFAWTGHAYLCARNLLLVAQASKKKPPTATRLVEPEFRCVMITWRLGEKPGLKPHIKVPRIGFHVVTTPPFPNVYIVLRVGNTCAAVFECDDGAVIKIPCKEEYYRVLQEHVEPITETAYERSLRNGR